MKPTQRARKIGGREEVRACSAWGSLHEIEMRCRALVETDSVAGALYCPDQLPVAPTKQCTIDRVHQGPACGTGWSRESRHYRGPRQKPPTRTADCYLCAQRAMVGATLA